MASIELKDISHSYDISFQRRGTKKKEAPVEWAIRDVNILWEDGTANALLGPSGCGKTTILNLISGLLKPTKGQVLVDGRDVTDLSPEKRHIAQVFQFPVVYDSMNVYNNLAFPLVNMGLPRDTIKTKVEEVAKILGLTEYLKTPSAKLNSAEKQKISLGRGIIRDDTVAILLDEPLTVIDPKMKGDLRRSLKYIQKNLNITMIYVTHDQHEALTFADYVTIVKEGRIVQMDTPEGLYSNPVIPFVGYFIGSPGMNIIENCKFSDGFIDFEGLKIKISKEMRSSLPQEETSFQIGIRPESIHILKEDREEGAIEAKVLIVENAGSYKILTLTFGSTRIKGRVDEKNAFTRGDTVYLSFPEEDIKIFQDESRLY